MPSNTAHTFNVADWYNANTERYAAMWDDVDTGDLDTFCRRFPPGATIADIACGTGRDLVAGTRNQMRMLGSDIAAGAVSYARRRHQLVVQASFTALPYPDSSVDGVWAHAAVVHATDNELRATLAEIRRILIPGGYVYINTKTGDSSVDSDGYDDDRRWFRIHEPNSFTAAIDAAGFDIIETTDTADQLRNHVRWIACTATTHV